MKRIFIWAITFTMVAFTQAQDLVGVNPEHLPAGIFDFSRPVVNFIELSATLKLEYAEQGHPEGIPVILLHGYTDSRHSFDMILPYLPASLHVYAISQRGHGNSSKPQQGYHTGDFAKDIADFIQQLGIKNPILVGHSMGATIVQSFATRYPSLVRGIVLAGAFADYNKPALVEFKKMIEQLTDPVDTAFGAAFQSSTTIRPVPAAMMKLFIEETWKAPAYVWKGIASGWDSSDYTTQLKYFDKPALIIWGDKDNFTLRKDQEILLQSLKKSKLLVYEGTGHAVHWEESKRFAKNLVDFVQGLK